jgi:hypothetical protein
MTHRRQTVSVSEPMTTWPMGPIASSHSILTGVTMVRLDAPPTVDAVADEPETHAELFPFTSPVARCVMSVSMARSDIALAIEGARDPRNQQSPAFVYHHRVAIGHLHEALYALNRYCDEHDEVRQFLARLPEATRRELKSARSQAQTISAEIDHSRQYTFHYPHPRTKAGTGGDSNKLLGLYLMNLRDAPVEINDAEPQVRLSYALQASFALAFGRYNADPAVLTEQLEAGAKAAACFVRFADGAVERYFLLRRQGKI